MKAILRKLKRVTLRVSQYRILFSLSIINDLVSQYGSLPGRHFPFHRCPQTLANGEFVVRFQ
jgi:hypothetical protein